jgi:hypothetical protein
MSADPAPFCHFIIPSSRMVHESEQNILDHRMMPLAPLGKKVSGSAQSGKRAMVGFAVVFLVLMIGVIAMVVLLQPQGGSDTNPPPLQETHSLDTMQVMPAPLPPDTEPTPVPEKKPVDFVLEPGPQASCGLTCRQLTPTITNTGDDTAHNVCINLVVSNSNGEVIFLNGAPAISQCVGDIAGRESRSEPIVIDADCGFLASKCIRQTLTLQTRVTSEERTVQFPDQMIAV